MKKTNLLALSASLLALSGASMLIACGDDTVGTGTNNTDSGASGSSGTSGSSGATTDGGADATLDSGVGTDATVDAGDAAPDAGDAATFPAPPVLGAEIDR